MVALGGRFNARSASVLLGGCFATGADVRAKLGQDYIGKSVDALVVHWGPRTSSFKMNSGDTAYAWQLATETSISIYRDGGRSASGRSWEHACCCIAERNGDKARY